MKRRNFLKSFVSILLVGLLSKPNEADNKLNKAFEYNDRVWPFHLCRERRITGRLRPETEMCFCGNEIKLSRFLRDGDVIHCSQCDIPILMHIRDDKFRTESQSFKPKRHLRFEPE